MREEEKTIKKKRIKKVEVVMDGEAKRASLEKLRDRRLNQAVSLSERV